MGDTLTAFNVLFESQMLLGALHTLHLMSNIKQLFYPETRLKDGMKSGLHLLGFLATAEDSIQLQFTSKKMCLLLL